MELGVYTFGDVGPGVSAQRRLTQLMEEVELVKRLSHPSIVKYEGMARDPDTLSIVLECVVSPHG